jgi:hypothetical protein
MPGGITWSVGLVVSDAEARALAESSVVTYLLEVAAGHTLRFTSPPVDGDEDIENFRIEVAAESGPAAREMALGIVYRARRSAGLPDRVVPVAWVSPASVDEEGENYFDQAEDLVEDEKYGLAIVAAEIYLQAQTKELIERAVAQREPRLKTVLLQHRTNLSLQDQGLEMIKEFFGVELAQLPEWQNYRAHLGRRNAVVHSAKSFLKAEAAESIAAVRAIWLHLAEASLRQEDSA